MVYGLGGGDAATLAQLVHELGVCREWGRRLQQGAERALKTALAPHAGRAP